MICPKLIIWSHLIFFLLSLQNYSTVNSLLPLSSCMTCPIHLTSGFTLKSDGTGLALKSDLKGI